MSGLHFAAILPLSRYPWLTGPSSFLDATLAFAICNIERQVEKQRLLTSSPSLSHSLEGIPKRPRHPFLHRVMYISQEGTCSSVWTLVGYQMRLRNKENASTDLAINLYVKISRLNLYFWGKSETSDCRSGDQRVMGPLP